MADRDRHLKKRTVAVITGSRAEYGILYNVIRAIDEDDSLRLRLLVTGSHLLESFGYTVRCIAADGFSIAARIYGCSESDSRHQTAWAMGKMMRGFADAYKRFDPGLIVALGDRYETFAAVAAAVPFSIPVAHIHGGELTAGSFDEIFRHAITKMSHLHFVATEEYARRVIQMGEEAWRVHCVGAPGIDNIKTLPLLGREELIRLLGITNDLPLGVIAYHPETLRVGDDPRQIDELLAAVRRFGDISWVITLPNNDPGNSLIIRRMRSFARRCRGNVSLFASLGRLNYLSLLKNAFVMVGNSSSGIIEAPSFGLAVVNIGDRQSGRIRGENVIDVGTGAGRTTIAAAIRRAFDPRFRKKLRTCRNPYGSGGASAKIVNMLKKISLDERLMKKRFKDFV